MQKTLDFLARRLASQETPEERSDHLTEKWAKIAEFSAILIQQNELFDRLFNDLYVEVTDLIDRVKHLQTVESNIQTAVDKANATLRDQAIHMKTLLTTQSAYKRQLELLQASRASIYKCGELINRSIAKLPPPRGVAKGL